jgi:hypothetical protein
MGGCDAARGENIFIAQGFPQSFALGDRASAIPGDDRAEFATVRADEHTGFSDAAHSESGNRPGGPEALPQGSEHATHSLPQFTGIVFRPTGARKSCRRRECGFGQNATAQINGNGANSAGTEIEAGKNGFAKGGQAA